MTDKLIPPLIMVVDDDAIMRALAEEAILDEGWRFHEEADGRAALEALETLDPDLMIVDVHMPELDGFGLVAAVRANPLFANLPILMVTADDDLESIDEAYERGATGFEVKPVNWTLLIHRIRYILRNAETLEQLSDTASALERSQAALMRAQKVANMGSWEWHIGRESLRFSDAAARLLQLGLSPTPSSIEDFAALAVPGERENCIRRLRSLLESSTADEFAQHMRSPNGQERVILIRGEPIGTDMISGFLQDITERAAAEERIRRFAYLDGLTGLPNQHLFKENLEKAVLAAEKDDRRLAVLYLDMDEFKRVNDTVGHALGDELLCQIAERIADEIDPSRQPSGSARFNPFALDAARLGGDEYAVVLTENVSYEHAAATAQGLIESISQPVEVSEAMVTLSPSVGIAMYPDDGDCAEQLMHRADIAMFAAKKRGKGNYSFFDEDLERLARRRMQLTAALHTAIENNELFLVYQPKVDLVTGRPKGAESLVRWDSAEFGLISPADFIPLAEESGLIVTIGDWVLREACQAVSRWRHAGSELETVAVNVSAMQFSQVGFVERVAEILRENQLPPAALELEITESLLASDAGYATDVLNQFKRLGVSLSIDDFGTGYSSLSYLKQFPVDNLKIDRSFISDIETNADDAAIAATIIRMAETLGLHVIAEGVETSGQLNLLKRERCDVIQGFYFAKPMRERELPQWLMRHTAAPSTTQNSPSATVLLVDDDARLLRVSEQALERAGFSVRIAQSAESGFEILANEPIGVVVSDYDMGEMNGVEFLRRVSRIHPEVVRIMLSGEAEKRAVIEAVNQGAIAKYFEKPISLAVLREAVREALGGKGIPRQVA